jgi:hypothetical protein
MKLKTLALCVALLAVVAGAAYFLTRPETPPPADPRVGRPLIGDLNEAKLDRFVTANPDRLARLEFKDSKIALFDASGRETWSLGLGKTAATGNGRFVRFGQEPKAFVTGLQSYLDPEAKNWADAQLLNLKAEEIKAVELPLEKGGDVTLSRAKPEGPWIAKGEPADRKVKADAVSSALASLASLRFSDTTALDDAAAKEAGKYRRNVALTTFSGQTYRITLGRRPEEKKLKPPVADAKSGPASLGKSADVAKPAAAGGETPGKPGEAKPGAPEFETIAAGPVFATVSSSDSQAPVNALMKRRAFEIDDYTFTSLPKTLDDLLEPAPPKAKAAAPAAPAAATTKPKAKPEDAKPDAGAAGAKAPPAAAPAAPKPD